MHNGTISLNNDDEEEALLKQNPDPVPLLLVNLDELLLKREGDKVTGKEKHEQVKEDNLEMQAQKCGKKVLKDLEDWIKMQKGKEESNRT